MKKLMKREEGFTIIEVVLVLAIAGLIFLVVFLALPQLQRSRRDTQRRSDVGRILASLETYSSNHNGVYPDDVTADDPGNFGLSAGDTTDATGATVTADQESFLGVYFGTDNFSDPSDGQYVSVPLADLGDRPGNMDYVIGHDCSDPTNTSTTSDARAVKVTMQLEQDTFCQDNR